VTRPDESERDLAVPGDISRERGRPIGLRSIIRPWSGTANPSALWPPQRIPISRSRSRAVRTAVTTSATLAQRMGPREAGWIESAVAALAGTGLTGDERLAAVFLLFGHVRNTQSMATAGTQPWSGGSELAERIRGHAELFPELSRALSGPAPALDDNARKFGLDRILDGLAVLIAERS
jgi:hypothetical protein